MTCVFVKYTATAEIYTLSLHDALPISAAAAAAEAPRGVALRLLLERNGEHALVNAAGDQVGGDHRGRAADAAGGVHAEDRLADRKSTRLNSSHAHISYAVFCLKQKTRT